MQAGVTARNADGHPGYEVGNRTCLEDCVGSKGAFDCIAVNKMQAPAMIMVRAMFPAWNAHWSSLSVVASVDRMALSV